MTGRMSRRQFNAMLGAGAAATLAGVRSARAEAGQVVVGTWGGDYQNFQQNYIVGPVLGNSGIQVVFDTANDTARKVKLMAEKRLPRGTMDIAALTGSGAYEMWKNGVLEELDTTKIPNWSHILPKLRTKYSVPHIFTGRVILYNPAMISPAPTSYADLWDARHQGKVGVIDIQYQTTIESAAMVSGGSLSNYEPGKAKLLELKKMGVKIYPTNEAMAQALKTGECGMCIMWQARGVMWQNAGVPVKIAVPKEGLVLYLSEFVVAKNARNKDAAYAYLNAALDPRPQVDFAKNMGYNPTVDNADVPAALRERIAYSEEAQKRFMVQDYEYLAANDAQLQDWWSKVFKG